MEKKALRLTDLYPIGDMRGATVKEAIMHNVSQVAEDFDNKDVLLSNDSIKLFLAKRGDYLKH